MTHNKTIYVGVTYIWVKKVYPLRVTWKWKTSSVSRAWLYKTDSYILEGVLHLLNLIAMHWLEAFKLFEGTSLWIKAIDTSRDLSFFKANFHTPKLCTLTRPDVPHICSSWTRNELVCNINFTRIQLRQRLVGTSSALTIPFLRIHSILIFLRNKSNTCWTSYLLF